MFFHTRLRRSCWVALVLLPLLGGCFKQSSTTSCKTTYVDGTKYCVVTAAIQETGFSCPAELPSYHKLSSFSVCALESTLSTSVKEKLESSYGKPQAPTCDQVSQAPDICGAGETYFADSTSCTNNNYICRQITACGISGWCATNGVCRAIPTCQKSESEYSSESNCQGGAESCRKESTCGITIWCGQPKAQCAAAPTCGPTETAYTENFCTSPSNAGFCKAVSICGQTIWCGPTVKTCTPPPSTCGPGQDEITDTTECGKSVTCQTLAFCDRIITCATPNQVNCDAVPTCWDGSDGFLDQGSCASTSGTTCGTVTVCGSTIWCPDKDTCQAVATCKQGETEYADWDSCFTTGKQCRYATICGNTIVCGEGSVSLTVADGNLTASDFFKGSWKNTTDADVYLPGCATVSLEKQHPDTKAWIDLGPAAVCAWEGYAVTLAAGGATVDTMQMKGVTRDSAPNDAKGVGTYRLRGDYWTGCTVADPPLPLSGGKCTGGPITVYSNVFSVFNAN